MQTIYSKLKFIVLLIVGLHLNGLAQNNSMLQSFAKMRDSIATLNYTARMMLKKFGHDQYTTRMFKVFARRNPLNPSYNFDWELIEYTKSPIISMLYSENEFYFINKSTKNAFHEMNIGKFKLGTFQETMRENVLFDEVIFGIDSTTWGESYRVEKFKDSTLVEVKINNKATRRVTFDAHFFPKKVVVSIVDTVLKDQQTLTIQLDHLEINQSLPDSVLSPEWYRKNGYLINYPEKTSERASNVSLTEVSKFLLEHEYKDFKDSIVNLMPNQYKVLMLDFWYVSCLPCLRGMPKIQKIAEQYAEKGLKVFGVNCYDRMEKDRLTEKIKNLGAYYQQLFGEQSLVKKTQINAFPHIVIMNRNGAVKYFGIYDESNILKILEEELNR